MADHDKGQPLANWHKHGMPCPIIIYPWLAVILRERGEWDDDYMIEEKQLPLTGARNSED